MPTIYRINKALLIASLLLFFSGLNAQISLDTSKMIAPWAGPVQYLKTSQKKDIFICAMWSGQINLFKDNQLFNVYDTRNSINDVALSENGDFYIASFANTDGHLELIYFDSLGVCYHDTFYKSGGFLNVSLLNDNTLLAFSNTDIFVFIKKTNSFELIQKVKTEEEISYIYKSNNMLHLVSYKNNIFRFDYNTRNKKYQINRYFSPGNTEKKILFVDQNRITYTSGKTLFSAKIHGKTGLKDIKPMIRQTHPFCFTDIETYFLNEKAIIHFLDSKRYSVLQYSFKYDAIDNAGAGCKIEFIGKTATGLIIIDRYDAIYFYKNSLLDEKINQFSK